jgi:hypothetical protein
MVKWNGSGGESEQREDEGRYFMSLGCRLQCGAQGFVSSTMPLFFS